MYFRQIKNSPSKLKQSQKGEDRKVPPLIRVASSRPKLLYEQKPPEVSRVLMMDNSLVQSQLILQDNIEKDIQENYSEKNQFMGMQNISSGRQIQSGRENQEQFQIQHINTEEQQSQKTKQIKGQTANQLFEYFVINKNQNQDKFLNKNSTQLLFNMLANQQRFKIYLKYLQNLAIQLKNSKKVSKNIQILICLLLKLSKAQTQVSLSSSSSKNFKINFTTPQITQQSQKKNTQLRKLRNQILQKDQQIYNIKTKYDEVIYNYALSISNLNKNYLQQQKQQEQILLDFRASKPLTFQGNEKNSRKQSIFIQD